MRTQMHGREDTPHGADQDDEMTQSTAEADTIDFALVLSKLETEPGSAITTAMADSFIAYEAAVLNARNNDFPPARADHSLQAALSAARARNTARKPA